MADKNDEKPTGDEEKMETEPIENSDSEDSSSDDGSDDEGKNLPRISEIEASLVESPFLYDLHVELIKLLREDGNLDKLRIARRKMSDIYPLTEELWLQWIDDETKVQEKREKINEIFEMAIKDYLSPKLWLEYGQYSIGALGEPEGLRDIRDVFERGVTAVGLHVTRGSMLWEAYREFENALLTGLQPGPGAVVSAEQQSKLEAQMARVQSLFKRQLSIPLQDMTATWAEYQEWASEVDKNVQNLYQKASEKLAKLQSHEAALRKSASPHLEAYYSYIDYELSQKEPARIQCVFERAITDNCLVPDLWDKYVTYLDEELQIRRVCISAHRRAVRNCPWSSTLWTKYLRALERFDYTHEEILEVFEKSMGAGYTTGPDWLTIWTAKCDYMRRQIDWESDHEKKLAELRETFESAISYLQQFFPQDGDPNCTLMLYWARLEAKHCKNMEKARELWNQVMTMGFGNQASMWLEFFNLERSFGDHKHCRKVLQRAVNSVTDWPDSVCDVYINFEREEGTLEQYDQAVPRCRAQLKRSQERLAKAAEKESKQEDFKNKLKNERKAAKKAEKKQFVKPQSAGDTLQSVPKKGNQGHKVAEAAPHTEAGAEDQDGFKKPSPPGIRPKAAGGGPPPGFKPKPGGSGPPPGFKPKPGGSGPPPGFKGKSQPPPGYQPRSESDEPQPKRAKVEESSEAAEDVAMETATPKGGNRDDQTVFVSNLDYGVDEARLKTIFGKMGQISEIRLVKNFKGKSKGFAYVEFTDEFPVSVALRLDREEVDGRPMFVSRCETKATGGATKQFKFATELEKNKLFIKNLPFSASKEDLVKIFSQHGKLKEVRLVTYRSGAPKGLAYVEFEDESCAAKAIMKTDGLLIGDHEIAVALSNPPQRKAQVSQREAFNPALGGGKKDGGSRKSQSQLQLVPRALKQAPAGGRPAHTAGRSGPAANNGSAETGSKASDTQSAGKMSNDDFRNMLLKK